MWISRLHACINCHESLRHKYHDPLQASVDLHIHTIRTEDPFTLFTIERLLCNAGLERRGLVWVRSPSPLSGRNG